jgi:hypothetical protein
VRLQRQDYIEIAACIKAALDACENDDERLGVSALATRIANLFAKRATKFDAHLFLQNAGCT